MTGFKGARAPKRPTSSRGRRSRLASRSMRNDPHMRPWHDPMPTRVPGPQQSESVRTPGDGLIHLRQRDLLAAADGRVAFGERQQPRSEPIGPVQRPREALELGSPCEERPEERVGSGRCEVAQLPSDGQTGDPALDRSCASPGDSRSIPDDEDPRGSRAEIAAEGGDPGAGLGIEPDRAIHRSRATRSRARVRTRGTPHRLRTSGWSRAAGTSRSRPSPPRPARPSRRLQSAPARSFHATGRASSRATSGSPAPLARAAAREGAREAGGRCGAMTRARRPPRSRLPPLPAGRPRRGGEGPLRLREPAAPQACPGS